MGSRWGINRTVGQIYALLFISRQPLNAETITAALGVSRSNTSMGLKELQSWDPRPPAPFPRRPTRLFHHARRHVGKSCAP